MSNVARAFDEQSQHPILGRLRDQAEREPEELLPWATLVDGAMPPMMFQLRFHDGRWSSYSYSDLREVHCRDAGAIQLLLNAMKPLVITIEGRHLKELAGWFGYGMVRWVQEGDPRDEQRPETVPEVVKITVEEILTE